MSSGERLLHAVKPRHTSHPSPPLPTLQDATGDLQDDAAQRTEKAKADEAGGENTTEYGGSAETNGDSNADVEDVQNGDGKRKKRQRASKRKAFTQAVTLTLTIALTLDFNINLYMIA